MLLRAHPKVKVWAVLLSFAPELRVDVEGGQGVVILTDMFGGTPSNLAHSLLEGRDVEIVAGMNLPLLIKLASVRKTKPLHEAVMLAQEAGRKYIYVASHVLNETQAHND